MLLRVLLLLLPLLTYSQKPCEFSVKVNDSLGSYRATKNYLMYERNFAGTSNYIYFSLALTDGLPTLNMQMIGKSRDFIKANCLDKNSRLYLQLANGKIITLLHMDTETCGNTVRSEDGTNNRVLSGYFLFPVGSMEELKNSAVSMMRIKFSTEILDYVVRGEIKSEMDGLAYQPERFFIETLHCLED